MHLLPGYLVVLVISVGIGLIACGAYLYNRKS